MKDGFHKIAGYDVYVENDKVLRGVSSDWTKTTYVYRACKKGGWDCVRSISVDAFRAGVRRGTIKMF